MNYDGTTYSRGTVVSIYDTFHVICQDFPFKRNPKPKELPTRDWAGEDGLDVYVPSSIPMQSYDLEVTFLYKGTDGSIRADISNFIDFLYGKIKGKNSDSVQSGRLAIYDEYVGMGRKDVVVSEVSNDIFLLEESDVEALAKFKVKFTVYDPTTEVTPTRTGSVVTNLAF